MANKMPSITISGDKELTELVLSIPDRMLTAVTQAMRKVAKPIINAARANLYKNHGLDTGLLRKSIGVRALKADRKTNRVWMYIGPRGEGAGFVAWRRASYDPNHRTIEKKGKYVPIRIAHLVEFGHKIKVAAHNAIKPAWMRAASASDFVQARPFLRPAVDANRGNFNNAMKQAIRDVLAKRAKKASKP